MIDSTKRFDGKDRVMFPVDREEEERVLRMQRLKHPTPKVNVITSVAPINCMSLMTFDNVDLANPMIDLIPSEKGRSKAVIGILVPHQCGIFSIDLQIYQYNKERRSACFGCDTCHYRAQTPEDLDKIERNRASQILS